MISGMRCTSRRLEQCTPPPSHLHCLGTRVLEIVSNDRSGTYRAVYTVSIGDSIYVMHAFQKKSKTGIATPKNQIELVRRRLTQLKSEVNHA
ncbi:MAG: type II toxin-antitoxin system RelE/ParE family toxin [Acidobacteriota bacterium]